MTVLAHLYSDDLEISSFVSEPKRRILPIGLSSPNALRASVWLTTAT